MKKYRYKLKFRWKKGKDIGKEEWDDEWSNYMFYSYSEAEEKAKGIQLDYKSHDWASEVTDYEIQEIDKMIIEGIVNDHGDYEDYTVDVGNIDIANTIIKGYRGNKIRITIEYLE